jgi:ATP-binding cassette subfamily B protein/subfamily B ATP-binding cassette protein MsbA
MAKQYYRRAMRIVTYNALTRPITELMGMGVICLAILAGGYLVLSQETQLLGLKMSNEALSVGAMITFYALLVGVSDPGRKLADVMPIIQKGAAAAERIYEMMDREPAIVDPPSPKPLPSPFRELVFDHVSFRYTPDQPVLTDIQLRIPFGQTVAIVGPNGCGKSTLINLISRFYDVAQGQVRLDDVDIRDVRLRDLREQIGIVTQQTLLFDDSVLDNIRYGSPEASDEQVIQAARQALAHTFIESNLEHGYHTIVGEQGGRLSGGQRQRIALARAILRNPSILILDEATSQVDNESEQLIHEALRRFVQGRTTIMITHRSSTLALADRIIVMDEGRIVDDGCHADLIHRCPLYQRLYQSDLKRSA